MMTSQYFVIIFFGAVFVQSVLTSNNYLFFDNMRQRDSFSVFFVSDRGFAVVLVNYENLKHIRRKRTTLIGLRKRRKIGVRAKINVRFSSDPPKWLEMAEDII